MLVVSAAVVELAKTSSMPKKSRAAKRMPSSDPPSDSRKNQTRSEKVNAGGHLAPQANAKPISNPFVLTGTETSVSPDARSFIDAVAKVWDTVPTEPRKLKALADAKVAVASGEIDTFAVNNLYIACGMGFPKDTDSVNAELKAIALAGVPVPLSKHPKVRTLKVGLPPHSRELRVICDPESWGVTNRRHVQVQRFVDVTVQSGNEKGRRLSTSRDRVTLVKGASGSGKTFAMLEAGSRCDPGVTTVRPSTSRPSICPTGLRTTQGETQQPSSGSWTT